MALLTLQNISKTFPGVQALSDVSFPLEAGEVHAVCGENGAGKSTLMNILAGNLQPDSGGQIFIETKAVQIRDFNQARELGIAIVYQERSLVEMLSIAENIFANRHPKTKWGLIDYPQLYANTQALLQQLNLTHLSPKTRVETLSPAERQMVEIAKALSQNPRILILDEPTASITEQEINTLFSTIRQLKKQGIAVIYISHRMAEIFEIADRVTVLKDGRYQVTLFISETNSAQLIKLMVGRDLAKTVHESSTQAETLLEVKGLESALFEDINFYLKKGEIVALAGLVGAGRTEIARAIFGMDTITAGSVWLDGQLCSIHHPADAISYGIGYVPEDRKNQGLFLDMSVQENIVAGRFSGNEAISTQEQLQIATQFKEDLRIQTPAVSQKVRLLSGGNQQKCVLARWLHLNPKVLIVDEPTHGVDVGAKLEIYELLHKMALTGTSILLISSELPEVLALADRILVVYHGKIAGELSCSEATEERILALASGELNDE
ncbi:sugar ABC transporter ATP-binding protein [Runella slithyformis]|uniref:Monosaccharide-transporting ATPase n=1 Tax=Runella slithyformis (strain ATCC 29530 / DSM 19594 / LMG 11500 / NCIMB 11436 / LSU 4) TaxID=761193 RepID=A0A7U4E6V3_RUNSL|nr:sugar ABC transporter ATP-binding protein [Runella slithyformis]AEI49998.1 Monosaccharide-transporting ATPase [Runella slithyformis DSM 19594]